MEAQEARSHPRHLRNYLLEYTVISGSGYLKLLETRTLDFSLGGARVELREQLAVGDSLSVRIEVPDFRVFTQDDQGCRHYASTAVMCFGKVQWIGPAKKGGLHEAGIRFERMTVADRDFLRKMLQELPFEDLE